MIAGTQQVKETGQAKMLSHENDEIVAKGTGIKKERKQSNLHLYFSVPKIFN